MSASPPISPLLQITVTPDRERAIVAPAGELDLATTPAVEQEVAALRARGFAEISLDLSDLTYFDSSGLRLLMRLDSGLRENGCRFTLTPGAGVAARVLGITHLHDRFPPPAPR